MRFEGRMAAVWTVPSSRGSALPMRLLVSIVIVEGGVQRSITIGAGRLPATVVSHQRLHQVLDAHDSTPTIRTNLP